MAELQSARTIQNPYSLLFIRRSALTVKNELLSKQHKNAFFSSLPVDDREELWHDEIGSVGENCTEIWLIIVACCTRELLICAKSLRSQRGQSHIKEKPSPKRARVSIAVSSRLFNKSSMSFHAHFASVAQERLIVSNRQARSSDEGKMWLKLPRRFKLSWRGVELLAARRCGQARSVFLPTEWFLINNQKLTGMRNFAAANCLPSCFWLIMPFN